MKRIAVFDTTLRDGLQAPGNELGNKDRIELFHAIDQCGVDYIEVGFPIASQSDYELTSTLSKLKANAKLSTFARARQQDIDLCLAAFGNRRDIQIQILLTGSEVHLMHKRQISEAQAIREAVDSVSYAKSNGVQDISVAIEDASRASLPYMIRIIDAALSAGATTVVLADTVGCSTPIEIGYIADVARKWIGNDVALSVHCHNDMGLAVANTLSAIKNGADVVQTTFCGVGERTGNTSVEELLAVLLYKQKVYEGVLTLDPQAVYRTCSLLLEKLGVEAWKHKPILGRLAFATSAGIHVNGMRNNPITYEYVNPERFGCKREVLLSRVSGKSTVASKLDELGMEYDEQVLSDIYAAIMSDDDPFKFNEKENLQNLYQRLTEKENITSVA